MKLAGQDVVREEKIATISRLGNKVSVNLFCSIDGFGIELGGTKLDDPITLWTCECVTVSSLMINKSNKHSLHQFLCASMTFRG